MSRQIRRVPSAGWVRFRHWLGVAPAQIAQECSELYLPGYETNAALIVQGLLTDVPTPPVASHLTVIEGGRSSAKSKKGKRKKGGKPPDPIKFLTRNLQPDRDRDRDMYVAKHRLDYYAESDAGRVAVENALRLWSEAGLLREVTMDMLLAGDPVADVAAAVRGYAKAKDRRFLRNVDITAFRDLFWDFRGQSTAEVAQFLSHHPAATYGVTALSMGSDVALQRLGLVERPYSPVAAKHLAEQCLLSWLEARQIRPEAVNISELRGAVALIGELEELQIGASGGADAIRELQQVGISVERRPPIPALIDVMTASTEEQRTADIDYAVELGALTEQEADVYRAMLRDGVDFGTEVRDAIRASQELGEGEDFAELFSPLPSTGVDE